MMLSNDLTFSNFSRGGGVSATVWEWDSVPPKNEHKYLKLKNYKFKY